MKEFEAIDKDVNDLLRNSSREANIRQLNEIKKTSAAYHKVMGDYLALWQAKIEARARRVVVAIETAEAVQALAKVRAGADQISRATPPPVPWPSPLGWWWSGSFWS